jgi:hypothetical protein
VMNIVGMIIPYEKCCPGIGSITQVTELRHVYGA